MHTKQLCRLDEKVHASSFFPYRASDWSEITTKECNFHRWSAMIEVFQHYVALGCTGKIILIRVQPSNKPTIEAEVLLENVRKDLRVTSVAWTVDLTTFEPLLVFSAESWLYVWDAAKQKLRDSFLGHGGIISSIAVSHLDPNIVATSSADHTIRIWHLSSSQVPVAERAGVIFPHITYGLERTVHIMRGGRNSGHVAKVTHADFHPSLPLLASSSIDRSIRIWMTAKTDDTSPSANQHSSTSFSRPIFKSSSIHDSAVISVMWLTDDLLVSQSVAVVNGQGNVIPGSIILWRWLGWQRVTHLQNSRSSNLEPLCRPEADSFQVITKVMLPSTVAKMKIHVTGSGQAVILLPDACGLSHTSCLGMSDLSTWKKIVIPSVGPFITNATPPFTTSDMSSSDDLIVTGGKEFALWRTV